MRIRPVWGFRQWITNEARQSAGQEVIEGITKEKVLNGARQDGGEPTEKPLIEWESAFWVRRMGRNVPDWVTDEDWELRCSVKCLGAEEEADESELTL